MWVPFLMCLVLTGIHAYLGLHVIAREVVFVDIALAQIAALGATAAFLWGYDLKSWGSYVFGLSFTILGGSVPRRLAIGWSFGTLVSVAAMVASAIFDLPTGATVVCAFGVILLVLALTTRMSSGAAPA